MDPKEQLKRLQAALAEAKARMSEESLGENERSQVAARAETLEREIGAKSAEVNARYSESKGEVDRLRDELGQLKREKADREIKTAAGEVAAQIAAGVKNAQEAEQERIRRMIAEEIGNKLGLDVLPDGSYDTSSMVQGALAKMRGAKSERTTPIETDLDGRPQVEREQHDDYGRSRPGRPAAPGVLTRGRGEKTGLHTFLTAVARKDHGAIRDLQAAAGMSVGIKALTEGGGASNTTDGPAGGYLVPPDYSTELIELLRAREILRRAGADIIQMTSPQYFQPRMTGAATATYVGEAQSIPLSQETFDQIALNAKKLTSLVPISNELLRDSRPSAEQRIKADMAKVIALKEDITFLYGAGTSLIPQGILNRSDITKIPAVGANGDVLSYDTLISAIFGLETANLPAVNRVWLMHPLLLQKLVSEKDGQGRPLFANYLDIQNSSILPTNGGAERVPTLLGMPIFTSTQLPLRVKGTGHTSDLALVEMSEVLIGNMEEMYMDSSAETSIFDGTNWISAFQSDLTVFRAIMRHDINLVHPQAVVLYQDLVYL